jgi:predicted DCC family thiol-disulfide oxidoreductase YuxK
VGEDNSTRHPPVILFDGICNLCNASVQFIIKRDHQSYFKFAALQSEAGITLQKEYKLPLNKWNSVILINNGKVFDRSSAVLNIVKKLSGPLSLLYIFIIVPPFLRNFIYDRIAENRYKWYGKRNECMIPTPDLMSRFI